MKFYKKLILVLHLILVGGCMMVLQGCTDGSVSLEEALLAKEQGNGAGGGMKDFSATETGESLSAGSEIAGSQTAAESPSLLYVYVCGSVAEPGVYALTEGSRIVAAIEAAGGFLEDAATEAVNLAAPVSDGMQIVVPDLEEAVASQVQDARQQAGMINLNLATEEELCSLSGIGASKAEAILAYREEIGGFSSIEQLKNVTGIGDNLFEQIKESIYIE